MCVIGQRMKQRLRRTSAWLVPSRTDRVVAGVAGGIAERLGIDPIVTRLSFVVLSLAGGFGILVYAVLWLVGSQPRPAAAARSPAVSTRSPVTATVAVGLVVCGVLVLLRQVGLWFGDGLVWPIAVASFG